MPRPGAPRPGATGCPEPHPPGRGGLVPGTLIPGPRIPELPVPRLRIPTVLIPTALIPGLRVPVVPIARLPATGVVGPRSRVPGSVSAGSGGIVLAATGVADLRLVTGTRTVARAAVPGVRSPALLVRRPCAAHWDGSLSWVAWCRRASGSLHHAATQQRPATWSGALIPVGRPGRGSSPGVRACGRALPRRRRVTTWAAGQHVGHGSPQRPRVTT
jgi:hypothetical protein